MIDSVNFNKELTKNEFNNTVNSEFIEWNSYIETSNGIIYGSFFRGLKVKLIDANGLYKITFVGSFQKVAFKNDYAKRVLSNKNCLSVDDIQSIFRLVSYAYCIENKFVITRLDICFDLKIEKPLTIKIVKDSILSLEKFKRIDFKNSIYFDKTSEKVLIYDKTKELKNYCDFSMDFEVLRIEYCIKKPKLLFKDYLYSFELDLKTCFGLIDLAYSKIVSIKTYNIELAKSQNIKKQSDFDRFLITNKYDFDEISFEIELLKLQNIFKHKQYYSQLKSKYKAFFDQRTDDQRMDDQRTDDQRTDAKTVKNIYDLLHNQKEFLIKNLELNKVNIPYF